MEEFRVVHYVPGRLRVRLAQVAEDPAFGDQLRSMLVSIEGIRSVETRSLTGSVLVEYDPEGLDLESLLAIARMLEIVPQGAALPGGARSGPLAAGITRLGEALGSAIEQGGRAAVGALNPRLVGPALAVNAVAQRMGVTAIGASPAAAAAWVLASILMRPRRSRR